jgi:hypothetical protein
VKQLPPSDALAAKARGYARLTLAVGAAAAGRAADAMTEITAGASGADDAGPADSGGCALGVAIDEDRASDVIAPAALGLPRLGSWGPPPDASIWLHGETATPSAVISRMTSATEIEIHAHRTVDAADSAASVVVLSPDADGRYALSALDLRAGSLRAHPLVVLAACRAARTAAAYYREAWNLPSAFVGQPKSGDDDRPRDAQRHGVAELVRPFCGVRADRLGSIGPAVPPPVNPCADAGTDAEADGGP